MHALSMVPRGVRACSLSQVSARVARESAVSLRAEADRLQQEVDDGNPTFEGDERIKWDFDLKNL